MAAYEILLLNTAIPQIQAAQSGDTYVVPRDIAFSAALTLTAGTANGVPYLSSPGKVLTTGSALTFDGTNLLQATGGAAAVFRVGSTVSSGRASTINLGNNAGVARATIALDSGTELMTIGPEGNFPVMFQVNGTEKMRLDASGNLGLGVTPSAWNSSARCLDVLTYGGFFSENGYYGRTGVANNAYLQVGTADNYIYKVNSSAQLYDQKASTGEHRWFTAPSGTAGNAITFTQAMTLDASGNLGIGTTSISARVHVSAASSDLISAFGNVAVFSSDSQAADKGGSIGFGGIYQNTDVAQWAGIRGAKENGTSGNFAGYMSFFTRPNGGSNTERARITSGGSFLVGGSLTAPLVASDFVASFTGGQGLSVRSTGGTGYYPLVCWNNATSGDNAFVAFGTEGTYTDRGSISYNRAGGLVAYNTTSDYRAKDLFGPVQNSGQVIDALKVYTGKMKGATIERPMLVAHEAQEHVPYAVTGEKDAVNEDGTPKYQQMDVSSLVPLLLAEIQSLRARVAQLEAK